MVKFIKFWGPSKFSDRLMCVTWGVRGCVADVRGEGWVLETKSLWILAGDFLTSSEIWENKMILDFNFQKIHENTRNTTTYVWFCLVHLKVIPYFRLERHFDQAVAFGLPEPGDHWEVGTRGPGGQGGWLSETTASPWKIHQSRWRHLASGWMLFTHGDAIFGNKSIVAQEFDGGTWTSILG